MYVAVAVIYWVLCSILAHFQNRMEARVNQHDQEH